MALMCSLVIVIGYNYLLQPLCFVLHQLDISLIQSGIIHCFYRCTRSARCVCLLFAAFVSSIFHHSTGFQFIDFHDAMRLDTADAGFKVPSLVEIKR